MSRKFVLHPGDILLFKPRKNFSLTDKFIILGQRLFRVVPNNMTYVHVALVDNDTRYMLEATWPKTKRELISKSKYIKDKIEVYRVKNLTIDQQTKILNWAHNHLNEWYDVILFFTGFLTIKHTEICSTFVSHSFKSAGLDIPYGSKDKKFIVPDDYAFDKKNLERII